MRRLEWSAALMFEDSFLRPAEPLVAGFALQPFGDVHFSFKVRGFFPDLEIVLVVGPVQLP